MPNSDSRFFGGQRAFAFTPMDPLTAAAASGLRARMESLDMLGNNLANASSSGFKMDREFYSLYSSENEGDGSTLPTIDREWIDLAQGTIQSTGRPLDIALDGKGFFVVNGPSGPLYTRNGSFQLASNGNVVTKEGYALQLSGGTPLKLDSADALDISADGTVIQRGQTLGRLNIVDVNGSDSIIKNGATYFRALDPSKPASGARADVRQHALESSNVNTAESAVRMVSIMRQFEMLQKAISIGSDMNRKASEEVARL
jgi:flagellar basal-body rod protein FlgF